MMQLFSPTEAVTMAAFNQRKNRHGHLYGNRYRRRRSAHFPDF